MKSNKTFRLSAATMREIASLQKGQGLRSQAQVIEVAVSKLYKENNDHRKRFMQIYCEIDNACQALEAKCDKVVDGKDTTLPIKEALTEEEIELYNLYAATWHEMRQLPFFVELNPLELEDDF